MDMDKIKSWTAKKDQIKALKSELKTLEAEAKAEEVDILQMFEDDGITKMGTDDNRLIHTRTAFQAQILEGLGSKVADALRENGHEAMITVNSRTLTSFIKEEAETFMENYEGDDMIDLTGTKCPAVPDYLHDLVNIGSRTQLVLRKG